MSKIVSSLKWDPEIGRIASAITVAYVGYFYLTKSPVPNFFYSLCSSVVFKVILLAAFVAAILHRDYLSAGLIAVAYFMLCKLVGRGMWEMMEDGASTAAPISQVPNPTDPTSQDIIQFNMNYQNMAQESTERGYKPPDYDMLYQATYGTAPAHSTTQ